MRKPDDIVRFSADELARRRAGGESRTDSVRLRGKTEAELEADIASDPDFRSLPADWHAHAEAVMPRAKTLLSIRLYNDVVEWFRGRGPGYQTRINAVLRSYVERQRG